VGGLVLLGLFNVALVGGAIGLAVAVVRRRGVAPRTVAWLVAASAYEILLGAANVRTQVFGFPLFVGVLALLIADAREPSSRVFLVVPLLVLWANLHGSVVVAVCLVLLRAAVGLKESALRARSLVLAAAAVVAAVVTPYGLGIVGYYQHTLLNPSFAQLVTEWRPMSLSIATAPVMVVAAGAVWLTARHTRRLGLFAVIAELALVALAFLAVRNAVWLGFGSLMLLGPALEAEIGSREASNERLNTIFAFAGAAFLAISVLAVASRGAEALTKAFPTAAGDAVAQAANSDPSARVFADERFADWLMFEHPELVGRLAYDVRFEQLTPKQLLSTVEWKIQLTDHWRAAARGARVIVVALPKGKRVQHALLRDRRLRRSYVDRRLAVFVRG
jgi:hypothetical protein